MLFRSIVCINNLKQIGLGFVILADDHEGRFPAQVSVTNGGSMEFIASGYASPHFQTLLGKSLGLNFINDPRRLICPADKSKIPLSNKTNQLTDQNVSYFVNVDAVTNNPLFILAGDRHLKANGQPVKPGLFTFTTNISDIGWTPELHSSKGQSISGNIAFTDGHVQWLTGVKLPVLFQTQAFPTNRLAVP